MEAKLCNLIQFGQHVLTKFLMTVIFLKFFRSLIPDQQSFISLTWNRSGKFFNLRTSIIFSNFFFFSNRNIENLVKKWTSFFEKTIFWLTYHRYDHQSFFQRIFRVFAIFCTFSKNIWTIRNEIRAKSTTPPRKRGFRGGVRGVPQRT